MSMTGYQATIQDKQLTLTSDAQHQLATLTSESQAKDKTIEAVRIYVAGSGCTGMTYGMTFTDQRMPYDKVLESPEGFTLYVDVMAMSYLEGAEISYERKLTRDRFVFNNVFAATGGTGTCTACGCA